MKRSPDLLRGGVGCQMGFGQEPSSHVVGRMGLGQTPSCDVGDPMGLGREPSCDVGDPMGLDQELSYGLRRRFPADRAVLGGPRPDVPPFAAFSGPVTGLPARSKLRYRLPEDMTRHEAKKLISRAKHKKWVVNRRGQYEHGHGVATYLARYIRGGPIKNQRLMSLDKQSGTVTIRVSRRGEKLKTAKLRVSDFIGRVLLHVPEPGYRVVRSCGLYHHHYAEQLEACRQQLGGGHIPIEEDPDDPKDTIEDPDDDSWVLREDYCRICGCQLEIKTVPRGPPAPELARYWGRRS